MSGCCGRPNSCAARARSAPSAFTAWEKRAWKRRPKARTATCFPPAPSCHSAAATLNDCATATAFLSGMMGAGFSDDKVFFAIFTAYEEKNARFDETAFVSAGTRLSVLYPLKLADGLRTADYIFTFEKK